ncbi:MAG TPA: YggT family protein [Pyrinomonadaceae bacterium]|nr:YggT family protein [Pyrinomonadaceae bacterium]
MIILDRLYWLLDSAVILIIVGVIVVVLLRLIVNQMNLNPFGWTSLTIRRLTDPLIAPVRRALLGFGVDPKYAPLVTVLITILVGWFLLQLLATVYTTLDGMLRSLNQHAIVPVIGYFLFGLLSFYSLLIFMRVIFSWVTLSYSNRLMRFLVNSTEPLLGPLRRLIPTLGGFDISPIVALLMLRLFQAAIAGTLLGAGSLLFLSW